MDISTNKKTPLEGDRCLFRRRAFFNIDILVRVRKRLTSVENLRIFTYSV